MALNAAPSSIPIVLFSSPTHNRIRLHDSILCAANRRNRVSIRKSGRLVLQSAYIIASKLRLIPDPLDLLLTEFGATGGGGGGIRNNNNNRFWNGWFRFDGWGRKRIRMNLGIICAPGLWLLMGGKELVLVGRRGARDWALGFCCCAFLVGFVLNRDAFLNKIGRGRRRRKPRVF